MLGCVWVPTGGHVQAKLRALFELAAHDLNDTVLNEESLRGFMTQLYRGVTCFNRVNAGVAASKERIVVSAAMKECGPWFSDQRSIAFKPWFVWVQTKPPCMSWTSVFDWSSITGSSSSSLSSSI